MNCPVCSEELVIRSWWDEDYRDWQAETEQSP
jgi:hypothetical protein